MNNGWILEEKELAQEARRSREAVFSLGNGYIGCRGFFEEEQEGIEALGGIYIAGLFGPSDYEPWKGKGRELVNTPNFFYISLKVDGEQVTFRGDRVQNYARKLDMSSGVLSRTYIWKLASGKSIKLCFERFISLSDIHLAGQKLEIEALDDEVLIEMVAGIDCRVTNLNKISCEPYPIQPGRRHLEIKRCGSGMVYAQVGEPDHTEIIESQKLTVTVGEKKIQGRLICEENISGEYFPVRLKKPEKLVLEKMVQIYSGNGLNSCNDNMHNGAFSKEANYAGELERHCRKWSEKWKFADITIEGDDDDQAAARYNMFQLIQSCPEHDEHLSIGARGLTGEMYEGCVFWDMEIFKFPFFLMTNPDAARKLLMFRYHTLEEAKAHARDNWFLGAMYPWQVSEKGIEQTPKGVGAFYAIHIVSDVAHAVWQYYSVTGDVDFLARYGAEMLVETARFWKSRVTYDPRKDRYGILAVRGPNEYDVFVNNNAYTNIMAQENLLNAARALELISDSNADAYASLCNRTGLVQDEPEQWKKIAGNMYMPYNKDLDLYEEDDMYLYRVPLDLKKAKPTRKRIIDSTLSYEALPLYQVTKQSDVVTLMNLLPERFTIQQMKKAWEYYEPRTAHDSSLSYSPHAVMAARIGQMEEAYMYFKKSAYLDIENIQLNTISGLHFANFGGTWQAIVFGFAGIKADGKGIRIDPRLPGKWHSMSFRMLFKGSLLNVNITKQHVYVLVEQEGAGTIDVNLAGKSFSIGKEGDKAESDISHC